eukprot:9199424-Pyramimonas_sp.AAC.1
MCERAHCFAFSTCIANSLSADVQWQVELAISSPSFELVVISAEFAIDPIRGFLTREVTLLEWTHRMKCHRAISTRGGTL